MNRDPIQSAGEAGAGVSAFLLNNAVVPIHFFLHMEGCACTKSLTRKKKKMTKHREVPIDRQI